MIVDEVGRENNYEAILAAIAREAREGVIGAPVDPSALDYGNLGDTVVFNTPLPPQDVIRTQQREVHWLQFKTNVIREGGTPFEGTAIYVHPGYVFGSMCVADDQQYPDNEYGAIAVTENGTDVLDADSRYAYAHDATVYCKVTLKVRSCPDVVDTDGFPVQNFDISTTDGEKPLIMVDMDNNLRDERTEDGDHILYIKVAKIEDNVASIQYQEGPIWINLNRSTPACASSSSESSVVSSNMSPSGSGSGSGGDGSGGGDSKSTAIVPVPDWFHQGGERFAALYIKESPEVKFDDDFTVPVTERQTRVRLDPRFVVVCEPGTLRVVVSGDSGWAAGRIDGPDVLITCSSEPTERPSHVTVYVVGTRRGFKGTRFAPRTKEQFTANEAYINSHY